MPSLLVCLLLAVRPPAAVAGFRVCNETLDVLNVAIGQPAGTGFATEGWWVVTANSCSSIIKNDLTSRYIYLFVTNIYNQSVVSGALPMCVGRNRFKITGTDACYVRGYDRAEFKEIDTFDSADWTVFITR